MDDQILTLIAFTGEQLTYDQAAKLYRQSGNDVGTAANRFFDQGIGAIKEDNEGYDPSAFHADRYGQPEGGNIPSFNIDYADAGVDHYPHSGAPSAAPTRPPSRTSHHSGLGDLPMQSIENGQETGLIGSSKPVFGPATKDHYDASKWALVPTTSSAELIPDAAPSQRKREEDGPAVIKPIPNDDYLPALITILHSIPLYRNALLTPEISLPKYTAGENWWKGEASTQARIVEHGSNRDSAYELDIIHETQRLMAFLDSTDRAYGSVGALQQLEAWKESQLHIGSERTNDELLKFLVNWGSAYQSETSNELNGVLRSMVKAGGQNQECFLLDANVVPNPLMPDKTLYDVLDDNLFASTVGNAHIVDISNVLILRLENSKSDATGLDCKIPATFYADRYLEQNKALIDDMFQEMEQYESQLKEVDTQASKLKYHTTKTFRSGQRIETLKLLKTSMVAFKPKEDDLIEDPKSTAILAQLQSVYDNIERKLNKLEEQKKAAREALDSIGSRFRAPFDDGNNENTAPKDEEKFSSIEEETALQHNHTHPYKLCGVATRPGVYYLLHPDIKSNTPSATQWWRIEYSTAAGSEAYILRERLTLPSVLQKASSEYKSALLIYANDDALSVPPVPLSESLVSFVKQDNVRFLEELQNGWADAYDGPIEPIGGWNDEELANTSSWNRNSSSTKTYNEWKDYGKPNYSAFGAAAYKPAERNGSGADSGMSSATLTPNTEVDDEGVDMGPATEMIEVHQTNWSATTGESGPATNTATGSESMKTVSSGTTAGLPASTPSTLNMHDADMMDVDLLDDEKIKSDKEPTSQHIEVLEKKGG